MVQSFMAIIVALFSLNASAQSVFEWSGNELEPVAVAWIMGSKSLSQEQFRDKFVLELSSFDSTSTNQDAPMWFRFTNNQQICDVQVGTKSKMIQAARCQ